MNQPKYRKPKTKSKWVQVIPHPEDDLKLEKQLEALEQALIGAEHFARIELRTDVIGNLQSARREIEYARHRLETKRTQKV